MAYVGNNAFEHERSPPNSLKACGSLIHDWKIRIMELKVEKDGMKIAKVQQVYTPHSLKLNDNETQRFEASYKLLPPSLQ